VENDVSDKKQAASDTLPPHVQLIQMAAAYWRSRMIFAAAELGLADQLTGEPKSATELAGPLHAHAPSLGILTERPEQRYALTSLGEALTTGAPGSAKTTVLVLGSRWFQGSSDHIVHSIRTGQTGFEKAQGMSFFDYLAKHPEDASLFSEAMYIVMSLRPLLRLTIFQASTPSSMSAARPAICWRPSSHDMQSHAVCCSTGRMWSPTQPHCLKPKV
jgi:hypothetical protein